MIGYCRWQAIVRRGGWHRPAAICGRNEVGGVVRSLLLHQTHSDSEGSVGCPAALCGPNHTKPHSSHPNCSLHAARCVLLPSREPFLSSFETHVPVHDPWFRQTWMKAATERRPTATGEVLPVPTAVSTHLQGVRAMVAAAGMV